MEVVRKIWVARARGQGREVELWILDNNHCALQLHAHVLFRCAVFGMVRHAFFPLLRSKLPWWTARRRMELALLSQPWWKALRHRWESNARNGQEDPAGCVLVKEMFPVDFGCLYCNLLTYTNEKSGSASHSPNTWGKAPSPSGVGLESCGFDDGIAIQKLTNQPYP